MQSIFLIDSTFLSICTYVSPILRKYKLNLNYTKLLKFNYMFIHQYIVNFRGSSHKFLF